MRRSRRLPRLCRPHLARLAAALALVPALTGCGATGWNTWRHREPPCVLTPEVSQATLVDHVNQNIVRLQSWRSTDVRISMSGMGGMSAPATIAVESPRRFRLIVSNPIGGGNEVDLGSNAQHFWYWTKENPQQRVLFASHEQTQRAQEILKIPFEPDWLMEALGVVPINPADVVMRPQSPQPGMATLVSERPSPHGPLRKEVVIDTCHGRVLEHGLFSPAGQLIAKARFSNHRTVNGVVVPHRIQLDWPQARMALTLEMRHIAVNGPGISDGLWQMPYDAHNPPIDLGRVDPALLRTAGG